MIPDRSDEVGGRTGCEFFEEDGNFIYEIAQWEPEYRDRPPVNEYEDGEFTVQAGDTFTTSCTWDNTTEAPLGFPEEMCVTFGFAYESKLPLICAPA